VRIHASSSVRQLVEANRELIERLGSVETIEFTSASMANLPGVQTTNWYELSVVYEKPVDVAAERERLSKELKKLETEMANAQRQLGNENFLAKAPPSVVEGLRRRSSELQALLGKTKTSLEELEKHRAEIGGDDYSLTRSSARPS
jgi:valyl-tRNA synthetase